MTRQEKIEAQTTVCGKYGCTPEQTKRHIRLFVDEQWQVHPSKRFKAWWKNHPDFKESQYINPDGIPTVTALNCKTYWEEYLDAKSVGLA